MKAAKPPLVKSALDWAAVWHSGQFRKYPDTQVPYMAHVAGVTAILSRHGFSPDVVAAGALHDVIEDCNITFETLEERFGNSVAVLVQHVSEGDKSLSWEERKRAYLEHFSEAPWEAQAISLADKIDNLESILVCARSIGDPWAMFKRGRDVQLERFRELEERASRLEKHALIDEYGLTLAEVVEL